MEKGKMRTKKEIEVEVNRRGVNMGTILEVLLDIREFLEDIKRKT